MRTVALGELVRPAGTRAGTDSELPVYSVTKHAGFVPSLEYFKKQVFSRDLRDYRLVELGDFAYATIHLDEGSIGIAPERSLISPMYTVFRADASQVDGEYLVRFLKSPRALAQYPQLGKGAVHRRKAISLNALAQVPIPLPSLPEQRRIAAILDQADALRAKRRLGIALLSGVTRSVFHDMFGEPGGGRWPEVALGDVVTKVDSGTSPNCESRPAAAGEWGVLKLGAVTYGHFQEWENKAYLGDLGAMVGNEVRAGDVLMTRKNTRDLVGAVAVVKAVRPRLLLPDLVFRLHLVRERLDPRYFQAMMMNTRFRPAVQQLSSGSAGSMPNISKARLAALRIDLPPIDVQRDFAARVRQIEADRTTAQRSLQYLDDLFASLQTRAFAGQL